MRSLLFDRSGPCIAKGANIQVQGVRNYILPPLSRRIEKEWRTRREGAKQREHPRPNRPFGAMPSKSSCHRMVML